MRILAQTVRGLIEPPVFRVVFDHPVAPRVGERLLIKSFGFDEVYTVKEVVHVVSNEVVGKENDLYPDVIVTVDV